MFMKVQNMKYEHPQSADYTHKLPLLEFYRLRTATETVKVNRNDRYPRTPVKVARFERAAFFFNCQINVQRIPSIATHSCAAFDERLFDSIGVLAAQVTGRTGKAAEREREGERKREWGKWQIFQRGDLSPFSSLNSPYFT